MAPGARRKFGAPHVRTWDLSTANILYWRQYLWHCWDFSEPRAVIRHLGKCCPLPPLRSACINKHKIYNKTRQKYRYITIPIFRSIFFPRCYTVAHLCFIKYTENCQGNSKIFATFFAPYMVTDSGQKWLVMNMRLRQRFARAKIFLLKKSQILSSFFWFSKKPDIQHLASNKPNWHDNTAFLYQWSRNFLCRLELVAAELRPFVKPFSVTYGGNTLSSDGYYRCVTSQTYEACQTIYTTGHCAVRQKWFNSPFVERKGLQCLANAKPKSMIPSAQQLNKRKVSKEKKRKDLAVSVQTLFAAGLSSGKVKAVPLTRTPENVSENHDISFEAAFTPAWPAILTLFFRCFCL